MRAQDYDETTIKEIFDRLVDAWNRGSAADLAAPFAEDADFIAFEGTHLHGRRGILEFHQPLFDGPLRGTRLEGGDKFVRVIDPRLAVMHAWATTTLKGQTNASASRDSMQLFLLTKHGDQWFCDAMLTARRVTVEQQAFADNFATLSAGDQSDVTHRVATLRH